MTSSRAAIVERSPLDQIRQAEVDVTRRVAAARQAAEDAIREAHAQAADLKRQAREIGHREGLADYQATVSSAEDETRRLIAQARSQAESLRRRGDLFGVTAAHCAIAVVIGQKIEVGSR
jgi:flagellar biosynthesis/type III secretory pathway protein FliH